MQLRETHQQKEKALAAFSSFVARTSNHPELRAAKERQVHAIDASRLASALPEEAYAPAHTLHSYYTLYTLPTPHEATHYTLHTIHYTLYTIHLR